MRGESNVRIQARERAMRLERQASLVRRAARTIDRVTAKTTRTDADFHAYKAAAALLDAYGIPVPDTGAAVLVATRPSPRGTGPDAT